MSDSSRQLELFAETAAVPDGYSEARVRAMAAERLTRILAEARAADRMPWPEERVRVYRHTVPNMTNWLPPDEAERVKAEFAAHMARFAQAS
jgi:hypothetical protein